jgi:hypothetical protein
MKDEALSPAGFLVDMLPIAPPSQRIRRQVETAARRLVETSGQEHEARRMITDWLRKEFAIERLGQKLQAVTTLDANGLVAEVQKARGKRKPLSEAQVKALQDEHRRSVAPMQARGAEARQLERRVAELVNAAYGLTSEDVGLLWRTAPPRMPGEPPGV